MLATEPNLHVIHLYRESLLRRYLSFRIMKEDKRGPETAKQMTAPELRKEFEQWTADYTRFKAHFAHCPSIELSYESICNGPNATLATVQQFLGLERRHITPATTPNAPRRLQDLVPGLEQVAQHFVDTPWYSQFAEGLPRARARGSVDL